MYVVVVGRNSAGKIELTKDELQQMLDDAYRQGKNDSNYYSHITVPSYPITYTTTCSDQLNITPSQTHVTCSNMTKE